MIGVKTSFRKALWTILKPYWTSEEKKIAFSLLIGILVSEASKVQLFVLLNQWQRGFYDALQSFNKALLGNYLLQFSGMVTAFVIIVGYSGYFSGILANRWRRWLVNYYQKKWLSDKNYYLLQFQSSPIDNPDQRISEDLSEFPVTTISLITGLFNAILTLFSFSIILWNLSGSLRLGNLPVTIPGYMFWASFLVAGLGTYIMFKIGSRLTELNYQQEKFNADFRFRLIRIREAAEQIAFYQGEQAEHARLQHSFNFVFNNFTKIISLRKYLSFFETTYLNFSHLAGTLIALPRFLSEKLAIGILMQTSNAFASVNESLSFILYSYPAIANWRAVINRLAEFDYQITALSTAKSAENILFQYSPDPFLRVNDLTVYLPNGKKILHNIQFTLKQGQRLLIQGASGAGKSTFLRVLAGLWPFGEGQIVFPEQKKTLFLPQKPYLPLGSIKQILSYPECGEIFSEAEMQHVLIVSKLSHLIKDWDKDSQNWALQLSLGEQQRLAFARLLLHKPDWAFLDEATSALDEDNEQYFYQLLIQQFPDITIVSVGHRSTLLHFHHTVVNIMQYKKEPGCAHLTLP